jgi:hypothetical protein
MSAAFQVRIAASFQNLNQIRRDEEGADKDLMVNEN